MAFHSAVDAHTAAHLFNECVMTVLRKKTIILVTHQVELLSEVDKILVNTSDSEALPGSGGSNANNQWRDFFKLLKKGSRMPFQPFHPLKKNVPKLTRRKSKRSTGAYKVASRLASAIPPPSHVLSRGIGWQGIGILLNGLLGAATGSSVSVVIQISAGFMIFFSMLGKFGAFFASIPLPIFAAAHCILFGLVGVTCIKCGNPMDKELKIMVNDSSSEVTHRHEDGAFVKGEAMYLIFDDLKVLQSSPRIFVKELVQLGYKDFNNLTEIYQNVGLKEVILLFFYDCRSQASTSTMSNFGILLSAMPYPAVLSQDIVTPSSAEIIIHISSIFYWCVGGTSKAAKFLRANGISLFKVPKKIVKLLEKSDLYFFSPEHPPLIEPAQKALDWAVDE
ncbi:hypothetical protein Ahy_B09g098956 isoform D [Arachis hypogaea]|uniref:Uncharacterized protein n=1 Tax=Arachis hypogaea TaxID=3818 RepID=A0A444XSQ8_ARAHY|nr:hypothetical protein Ahy_B09g098956 isoform D [Arachis hypogaea]